MNINIKQKSENLIYIFLLFWFFSIIGSNLYVVNTALSIRNILFPSLLLIIYLLKDSKLTKLQWVIFSPLLALFLYGTIALMAHAVFELEIIKDYFYFTFIPILFASIMLLSRRFKADFFEKINLFSYGLLAFLFLITLFELFTDIHLPVHRINSDRTPSAFFTNPNDLAVIIIQLFFLISVLRKKTDAKWIYILAFVITGVILYITLSRLAVVAFIAVALTIFLSKSYTYKDIFINLGLILIPILYLSYNIPTAKQSKNTVEDRSKIRMNSMVHLDKEANKKGSSVNIRLDIYKIPFKQPKAFLFGYGFNSDKEVIEKYRTEDYKIINSHSFFIQMIFYFGWTGFFFILMFFTIPIIYALFYTHQWNYLIPIMFAQALLINIPSSIIRSPSNWIAIFIVIAYYIYQSEGKED